MADPLTDPQQNPQKVVKVGDDLIAFPGHFDDSKIINAIRAYKGPQQPTAQQVHTRATNPHFAPMQTEESEKARQLTPAKPLSSVVSPIDQALAPGDESITPASVLFGNPKEQTKGFLAPIEQSIAHPYDTLKMLWDQASAAMPAYRNVNGVPIPVPNTENTKQAIDIGTMIAQHPEYSMGMFGNVVLEPSISGIHSEIALPTGARGHQVFSNPIGDVRVGADGVPSVWLGPKGWDAWMKATHPEEDAAKIPGMNVKTSDALQGMFNAKVPATPEWLQVQHLIGKANDLAANSPSMTFLQNRQGAHFHVLPEEAGHSYQRALSTNGLIGTHLPQETFAALNTQIPEPTKRALVAEGYKATDPVSLVVETAAKYLAGDYNGATPQQAANFLGNYFAEVQKVHGPEALNRLEQTRASLAQMQEQINAEHQFWNQRAQRAGTQPSVPSVAARPTPSVSPKPAAAANAVPEPVFQRSAVEPSDAAFKREQLEREANFRDPNNWIAAGARDFAAREGRTLNPQAYSPVDFRNKEIADAYEAMQHNPNDPRVRAAYDAMKADIDKQWNYATNEMGMKFTPSKENPYATSQEMVNDVKNNHHLAFYQGGDMPADHPLAQVDPKTGLTYNDKLRAIHDLFGHAMEGFQFGPRGEENAWIAHSQMFSPEALPAVTTETKGQNSWVNAGPHLRDAAGNIIQPGQPGYIAPPDRPFAQQKAGLLPERFHFRNDAPISFVSPNTMDLSLPEAQQRINSTIQKRFAGASRDLANQLGLRPSVRSALGSWEGGAENSVIHQFPVGTDPDAVRYYNAILGKLGHQYSTGSFFPGEGPDSLYTFWVGGKGTSDIARTLLDHGIENSTIEPAEDGHAVYLIGSGDQFRAKVDQVAKALGHAGEIEEYGGKAEFPGNSASRDAAARDFSSTAEALESKHPEWKSIREGFESRPDINSLHELIQSTKTPVEPQTYVVHYSNTPGINQLDPSYYGQNAIHDVSRQVVDRPDLRRKQSFPNYWNPETYVGDESSPEFRKAAAERFAARGYTYKGAVPTQGIYDLAKDPDHIRDLARKELEARNFRKLGARLQPSDAEVNAYAIKRLKDLGYSGRRDVNGLIASFDKIPVQDANVHPSDDIGHYLEHEDALFRREPVKSWEDIRKFLTADEKARYNTDEKRQKIVDAVNSMPSPTEWDAAVKAGISGRLWYERSSRAFDALVESQPDMFRKTDKEKFLNFVAALSPVQPVRQNLLMAVNLWDKWNKAGRPVDVVWKDPENFSGIANKNSSLFRILKGGRNTYGVDLPARMQNAIRALQDQPLSGPKVSAFAPNLGSDTMKSTNDTWMALFGDTDPNRINQPHLYDAMSSMVREAGKKNGIPPRQAQAAIWSFIKSLAELSGWGKDNWVPPQEIIKQGLLTPDLINKHAADFADMLANDNEIRSRIQAIGGDLNALDRKLGKYVPERPNQGATAHVDPRLLNAAKRLEAARTNAKLQAHLERKVDEPNLLDTSFDPVLFKRQAQSEIPPGEEAPQLRQDNPAVWNGESGMRWLQGKKTESDLAGKTWWGAPNRIGTVTGYFDNHDHVMMPVRELAKIPGFNGEHIPGRSRQSSLDWLTNNFKQTGRLPQAGGRDYAPFIMVDQNGKPWVNEGNHRIAAANKAGMEYLPTEIRYFNGGEQVQGPLSPDKVQQYHNDAVKQGYTRDDYTPDSPKFLKQQADALFKREGDRRKNDALRKKISEMTPDEMRKMLLHSDVVDLPNGRSFDEAERDHPAPAVAMSDADGLKAFNDKFGYEAGNELLKAKAEALKQAGLEAYHEKGDEFLYRGQSPEDLTNKLEKARDILRNTVFDVTLDDGQKVKLKGVDFSYGVGHDLNEAEQGQHTHKAVREARGERGPRGQLGSITQVQGEDQVNQGPQDLASLKAEAAARNPDAAFKREAQTRSPEFRQWFKDSKVRDENGDPLVVYHGTDRNFGVFGGEKRTSTEMAFGHHFSAEPDVASGFADNRNGGMMYPVYLSIKHPLELSGDYYDWGGPYNVITALEEHGVEIPTSIERKAGIWNQLDEKLQNNGGSSAEWKRWETERYKIVSELKDHLKSLGYDGVKYENEVEGGGPSWIAFDSSQIKSSIGNRGTFDPNNPDIAFKRDKSDELDKLKYIDPKSSLGLPNAAALVTKDGNVSFGKWHENLATALGYEPKNWENEFMADGGIRVRANKGEISMKFGSDNSQTLDNVRNSINAVKGNKVRVEYFQNGNMKYHWSGTKNDVLQKLDEFEGNHGGGGATYGSAVQYYRDAAFKRENPFYLKSEKVIDDKMKGPMTASDLLRMLKNNGIKADEMKWTGLDDLLSSDRKITPQEIKDHLAQNAIQIKEVNKGQRYLDLKVKPSEDYEGEFDVVGPDGRVRFTGNTEADAQSYIDEVHAADTSGRGTKYDEYTEPGGQNYRELLLTMPSKTMPFEDWAAKEGYSAEDLAHPDTRRAAMRGYERVLSRGGALQTKYYTNHWPEQPNILAHVRMNDRTGPNGEKLLHIEEVQSDWHQQGRKQGYKGDASDLEQQIRDARDAQAKAKEAYHAASDTPSKESAEADFKAAYDKANRLEAQYNQISAHGVPDAPFKTDWHEMALRRMLQYAAENGYDGVSWTGGEKQAARYDLSKHVKEIEYAPVGDGTYHIDATDHNGDIVLNEINVPLSRIESLVGKEIAAKIEKGEGGIGNGPKWKTLSGLDLKVGGEGMKGFYDKIVPQYLNKFGKKFGAQVKDTEISTKPSVNSDVAIQRAYGGRFEVLDRADPHEPPLADFATREEAERYVSSLGDKEKFQYIPITPAMRQSLATEGVPMFKRGNGAVPKLDELKAEAARRAPVGAMLGAAAAARNGQGNQPSE